MAKRRLNKKVALIGTAVFVVFALAAIWVILRMSRDPQELIRNAEAALAQKDYKSAEKSLQTAFGRARNNALREKILFKLVDLYLQTQEWPFVLGCWERLITIDPDNYQARYGQLRYFYILADSGARQAWSRVRQYADEFIKAVKDTQTFDTDPSPWEVFPPDPGSAPIERLGSFLYLARGRASLEMAIDGAVTDRDRALQQASEDLSKVLEREPNNIDAYRYLAEVAIQRGQLSSSRGNLAAETEALDQAVSLLEKATQVAPDSPRAHINLFLMKLALARRSDSPKDQIAQLRQDIDALARKFPDEPEIASAVSRYYADYSLYASPDLAPKLLDQAIQNAELARKHRPDNVAYAIRAAELRYRRFSIYNSKPDLQEAIQIAEQALKLPGAQDIPGPRNAANISNRLSLASFLAQAYIEQILEPVEPLTDQKRQQLLTKASDAVHIIHQIHASADHPQVMQWYGMLDLAHGKEKSAVKQMYAAFERIKAVKPEQPPWPADPQFAQLCYTLAKVFKDTSQIGAVAQFLTCAINSYIANIKPAAVLDYVDTLLKFDRWSSALAHLDAYDQRLGPNKRSKILRIQAYIGAAQFDDAETALQQLPSGDPNTLKLKLQLIQARIRQVRMAIAQQRRKDNISVILSRSAASRPTSKSSLQAMEQDLAKYRQAEWQLMRQLLALDPNAVEDRSLITLCQYLIKHDQLDKAATLVDAYLEHFPDNIEILFCKRILAEPDPNNVSQQRQNQIREQILTAISDPLRRLVELGQFHRKLKNNDKAAEEFRQAIDLGPSEPVDPEALDVDQTDQIRLRRLAVSHLFDIAMAKKDWPLVEELLSLARKENLDGCDGNVFAARLSVVKGDYQQALRYIDTCLKERPVYSAAYLLRGNIYRLLGNEHKALADMRQAAAFNPLDGIIAKAYADALFRRYKKLGANATPEQKVETRAALETAISLNPRDLQLLEIYAEFVAPTESLRAIAIYQDLLRIAPERRIALRLAQLAIETARNKENPKQKQLLFDIAGSALDQAKKIAPDDETVTAFYAEYLRARGWADKAEQMLTQTKNERLLWQHYFQRGQYDQARQILLRLYQANKKDPEVVTGLLLVAEKTNDQQAVREYSEQLVAIRGDADAYLLQIQSFLRVGLVKEAEHTLESFTEKYPDEPRTLLLRAWLAMRKGQLEKAVELTNRNLEIDPQNAAAWRLRGEINLFRANFAQAIDDLKTSKSIKDEPATRLSLARAYLRVGRYEDAITELRNTINAPGAPLEARFLLEHIYTRLGRKDALKAFYEETLQRFPDNVRWLTRAAEFALNTSQFARAEELYKRAFELKRDQYANSSDKSWQNDALYASALDGYLKTLVLNAGKARTPSWNPRKLDAVFEIARKYVNTDLAPIAFLRMAQAKLKLGHKQDAVDFCRKAVEKSEGNDTLASEVLFRMFLMLGPEEVTRYCQQKLQREPNSVSANFTMFNLAKINQQYNKALTYIDKCIALSEPNSLAAVEYGVKKVEVLTLAYERSSDKKYLEMAIADYESLLEKMPNNISVLNNLAYLLAENDQRLEDALRYAEKAIEARPNDPSFLDTYAFVLHKNGKDAEAAQYLAAALQQYEQNKAAAPPEVYEHLGMVKEKLGQKREALAAYKQALEVGADVLSEKARNRIAKAIERVSQ